MTPVWVVWWLAAASWVAFCVAAVTCAARGRQLARLQRRLADEHARCESACVRADGWRALAQAALPAGRHLAVVRRPPKEPA